MDLNDMMREKDPQTCSMCPEQGNLEWPNQAIVGFFCWMINKWNWEFLTEI